MSRKITIVAFDKFTDVDVYLAWDLFNRVKLVDDSWLVKIVGTEKVHTSVTGLPLHIHGMIEECATADIVFFASGPGTRKLMRDKEYLSRFTLDPKKQLICSMCSGSLILAGLGLLNDITATTYPTAIEELKSFGVTVEEKPLVVHGNIATAAGCLAAIDLVGWAIERTLNTLAKDEVIASVQPVGKGLECIY
jgi:transcriptional regulator GlxA family with amidase domain